MYNDELCKLYHVKPGTTSEGFDTVENAIAEAVKQWLEYAPDGSVLVDYKDDNKVYARSKGEHNGRIETMPVLWQIAILRRNPNGY
jgi:hypothetical protein